MENQYYTQYYKELNRQIDLEYQEKMRMIEERAIQQKLQSQRELEYFRKQLDNQHKHYKMN